RLMLMALGGGLAQGGIGQGLRLAAQIGAHQQLHDYHRQKDLRDYLFKLSEAKRAQANTERKLALREKGGAIAPSDAAPSDAAGDGTSTQAPAAGRTPVEDSSAGTKGVAPLPAAEFRKLLPVATAAAAAVDRKRNPDLEAIIEAHAKKTGAPSLP